MPDYNEPVILPRSKSTVEDFCNRIHRVRKQCKQHRPAEQNICWSSHANMLG